MLIVLFVIVERRQQRPMLDLTLFQKPAFAGASIVAFSISASMFAMFLYLTLYIQDVLGYGPLAAGVRFLPITLVSFFVAPISGRLSVRVPVRLLLGGGLLLVSIGLFTMTAVDASSGWTVLVPGFLLGGVGIGLINPPLASTAVGVVHHSRSGMASGINNTFRQVGIATGIAGLGAIFQHEIPQKTHAALAATAPGREVLRSGPDKLKTALVSGEVQQIASKLPGNARAALAHAYRVGFTGAFTSILEIAADRRARRLRARARARPQPRLRRLRTGSDAERRRKRRAGAGRRSVGRDRCPHTTRPLATARHIRPASPAIEKSVDAPLVASAAQHRNARIARISWIDSRELAQREDGAARIAHLLLVLARIAQSRLRAPALLPAGRRRTCGTA